MLITRIELENIKSYRRFSTDLRPGTTAISGANGAGKTTLVEAIGYALFDYLPYNQGQFVREGEKFGRIVIHLIGGDERPYVVERRCGSASRWFIHDEEAKLQFDQRADVVDRLHDLFGIDRDRPLNSLFHDAIGVPQGTFTSTFLENPSKRKTTFDTLLQIEDYKTAAEYLLEVQRTYKEQMQTQTTEINRLAYETRELENWLQQLHDAHQLATNYHEQREQGNTQLLLYKERFIALNKQQNDLRILQQDYHTKQQAHQHHQSILNEREQSLQRARAARQIVDASGDDYQQYQQANVQVKQLRQDEASRNDLRQRQARIQKAEATSQANIQHVLERLSDIATARQRVIELAPFVAQQQQMEQQRDELKQKVMRAKTLIKEGQQLQNQLASYREKQASAQQRINAIEPLQATAALFVERNEALTQLRIRDGERAGKEKQRQEIHERLKAKQNKHEEYHKNLQRAELSLKTIEEHRSEAEEMPALQEQLTQAFAQKNRLEGNIEGYTKSRTQAADGQCPLLHETCLNIRGRGVESLEFYFTNLLKDERTQLVATQQRHEKLNERIGQIKRYAEALDRRDQYVERRDTWAEQVRSIVTEMNQLEQETIHLTLELDTLKQLTPQIKQAEVAYTESKRASEQVGELAGLYKQLQQVQEQIQHYETELQECRREHETLKGSDTQLAQVERELLALQDPRSRSLAQQDTIMREAQYQQQLQNEQQRLQMTQQQLEQLHEQLNDYQTLDAAIAQQEAILQQSLRGYQSYLQNEQEARILEKREAEYQQQFKLTQAAVQQLHDIEEEYQHAKDAFNQDDLTIIDSEIRRLESELSALERTIEHQRQIITQLEQQIATAEALKLQLEIAQKEQQTLDDLHTMTAHFRALIKEAAPHVLKAMLADISGEANRIFNEIMGDRSAQLSWQNDYEITLRRQTVNRTFAQLSGGEQMSAALAVRLALLKKLSNLNIAFFDEPTQNMDELRRMNLAEQIRRVRGFEQLIVISHDDTFEQGLDSIVRLRKEQGETHMVNEEGVSIVSISEPYYEQASML